MVDAFAPLWGGAYALWAFGKIVSLNVPTTCLHGPPLEAHAMFAALLELVIGVAVSQRSTRHESSLIGFAFCLGLILFAVIADHRGLPWKGCGCVWAGVDMPWVPGHVLFALALAVPFGLIFLHEERRARVAKRAEIGDEREGE